MIERGIPEPGVDVFGFFLPEDVGQFEPREEVKPLLGHAIRTYKRVIQLEVHDGIR